MLRNQIVDISYARISTNSTNQLSSLTNQYEKLNKKSNVILHIGSGRETFSDEFKNKIIDLRKENKDVRINVISFDRLTRNFIDMQFLYDNIRYIHILDEKQIYDMKIDTPIIASKIAKSIEELEIIKNRCGRKKEKCINIKNNKKKIIDNSKRKLLVFNNMLCLGPSEKELKILEKIIYTSQNLNFNKDWQQLYKYMDDLNLNVKEIKTYYSDYSKNNISYKLIKKDIIEYIINYFDNNKYEKNIKIINNFINSNMK